MDTHYFSPGPDSFPLHHKLRYMFFVIYKFRAVLQEGYAFGFFFEPHSSDTYLRRE